MIVYEYCPVQYLSNPYLFGAMVERIAPYAAPHNIYRRRTCSAQWWSVLRPTLLRQARFHV